MRSHMAMEALVVAVLLLLPRMVRGDDNLIPADKSQLDSWLEAKTKDSPALGKMGPDGNPKMITVKKDGSGDFKTVTDAIDSVPDGNTVQTLIWIGPGNYTEKIVITRHKTYLTLYGDPKDNPILVYDGTALKYGTVFSGTLTADNDYFSAYNLKVVNSAPMPDGKRELAQAVAMRAGGEFQAYYNCRFYGFQDTLCDIRGKHLFKDCYVEGTVDYIFGSGTSLYLNTEVHVVPSDRKSSLITAQAREKEDSTGFVFVHCSVTGTGGGAYLGRAWFDRPRVVFAYSDLSEAVHPEGWSNNGNPNANSTVFFGEYNNKGPGAALDKRAPFTKKLSDVEVKPFLSLDFIGAATWLQPRLKL